MGSYYKTAGQHYHRDSGCTRKFSKQQFLQANCQFVVLDGHDYTIHKVDPDWPVEWECIEEVRFKQCASSETSCPICLEHPIAAKITRCGHIYCWSCMLHYLSLSDEKCRQCPICFEPVYKSDLRSVVSHSFINYSVDDEITLKLMNRKKGCVEVEPYIGISDSYNNGRQDSSSTSSAEQPSVQDNSGCDNDHHYGSQANLVIVDSNTVIQKIIQRERDELLVKMAIDKNEPEVCFVEQAIEWLKKRIERLQGQQQHNQQQPQYNHNQYNKPLEHSKPIHYHSNRRHHRQHGSELSKNYLFYQCSDGQHIYLNPFSTKVLCHEFQSLENCPSEIKAKILQMNWISMNESWRKRFRYLGHLPLHCEFRLIEIDFEKSNLISSNTYKLFEEQIRKRAQERQRRLRQERKRDKIIQVEQDRKIYGIQPSLNINLNNTDQFPSVSDERYLGSSQPKHSRLSDDNINYDDFFSDDDYDSNDRQEVVNDAADNVDDSNKPAQEEEEVIDEPSQPEDVLPDLTKLSFKDIQLQEAALMEATQRSTKSGEQNSGAWSANNKNNPSNSNNNHRSKQSSSFAQLLVNAKTSQKSWTRNSSSNASNNLPPSSSVANTSSSHGQRNKLTSESDDGGDELRAPPNKFNINDFIDLNVATGKKKSGKSRKN